MQQIARETPQTEKQEQIYIPSMEKCSQKPEGARSQKPKARKKKTQMPNKIPLHAELRPLELHNR